MAPKGKIYKTFTKKYVRKVLLKIQETKKINLKRSDTDCAPHVK